MERDVFCSRFTVVAKHQLCVSETEVAAIVMMMMMMLMMISDLRQRNRERAC